MNGESYEVFVGAANIPADGFSKIPILVVGTDANGDPSSASMIVSLSRPDAGSITPFNITLGPLGAMTYLTPCNGAQNPSCLGPFNVTVALAAAPNTVVGASATVNLVAPAGVGTSAPCLIGGNVLFFDGDPGDWVHPGVDTITLGQWSAQYTPEHVSIHVTPGDQSQGLWWDVDLSSEALNQPLAEQVYNNAERWPFQSPGKPGMDVTGNGHGCNMLTGSFEIETLDVGPNNTLQSFTATFLQYCDGGPALHGCVHFGP